MSQTFYDLHIPNNLIGNRLSTKSVMIGSLFHLLQKALECGGFNADPMLARIIKQDPDIAGAISIATTRVPDFGEQISNPSHGFRSLCCLRTVTAQLQDIPPTFHPSFEVLASKSLSDNPVAINFAESFKPMGIDLVSHFNIIFYPINSGIPSLWGTSSAESSLSPWDSISAVQSRNASESPLAQVDVTATTLFQPSEISQSSNIQLLVIPQLIPPLNEKSSSSCDLALAQPQVSESSSPSGYDSVNGAIQTNHASPQLDLQALAPSSSLPSPLFPSMLPPQAPLPLPPGPPQPLSPPPITPNHHCSVSNESSTLGFQPLESESILTSSSCSTIPLLLKNYVISDEQKEAAIYKRNFKGLYSKVKNFNAMNFILDKMGYSLPFRVAADPTIKLSDITVKASEVLQHFGWAPTSFDHKTLWYGTAKTLSQRTWNRGMPGK